MPNKVVQAASLGVILVKLMGKVYDFLVKTFETGNKMHIHVNEVFNFKISNLQVQKMIILLTLEQETPFIRATSLYLTFLTLFFILHNIE